MTGISQKSDRTFCPRRHGVSHLQDPFVRGIDGLDEGLDILMPSFEVVKALLC